MEITPIQSNTSVLRPRARIIKTIGEELISDDKVALLELVKNSYDADSSIITIEIKGQVIEERIGKNKLKKIIKEGASIVIYDDGSGMSLNTIKTAWMEPATISKKNKKESVGKKRRYTGEKGIGRFASAKLSSNLEIITRVEGDNEVDVIFNWKDFDDNELYLDQVTCNWVVREPIEFDGNKHGTKLILTNLNSDWDEEKIRQFKITLQRLINPSFPILDFVISLELPSEFSNYSGTIESSDSLKMPSYQINGSIDINGIPSINYRSKKLGELPINGFTLLKDKEKFLTGPFLFDFRVWDLDSESLNELAKESDTKSQLIKEALKEIAGISIYRDGFRVLPYGDPKFDWVRLDLRRVNNPTLRISNNQIIGYVSIDLDKNPDFKDQSNREGLVESDAFTQLKEFIRRLLNELEVKRYEERPREDITKDKEGLFQKFSIEPIAQIVQSRLPNDKEIKDVLVKTEERIQDGVKRIQEVIARYRRLSTLGSLIDVILHDGNNFLAIMDSEIHLLLKELEKSSFHINTIRQHIQNIKEEKKVIAQLFKKIEPFGGKKRSQPKNIIVEDAIANVFSLYKTQLDKLDIKVNLPIGKNTIKIDESDFQMIFVNLLQNSIYWLSTSNNEKIITVETRESENELSIVFSDNGPGIKEEHVQIIFDPYFSTRPDGIGLGLTIVGEIVSEYEGDFCLIDNGPLEGASFKLSFRSKI